MYFLSIKKLMFAFGVAIISIQLSGCSGCSDSTSPSITSPIITSTSPSNGQAGLIAETYVVATFDREIDPATINTNTFTLIDEAHNPVDGTITYSDLTAVFYPGTYFEYGMTYTATLSSEVADTSGNTLASDYIWQFSIIDVLGSAVPVYYSPNPLGCKDAIFDSTGNAYVVSSIWFAFIPPSPQVWATRYTSTSGWGEAVPIDQNQAYTGCPVLGADGNGNIIAVWSETELGHVVANRYLAGSGWSTPEIVGGTDARSPDVAVDTNGNIFVVWLDDGSVWARRFEVGLGWGSATTIESYTADSTHPNVVVDKNGHATVLWTQKETVTFTTIEANRYTVGSGWGAPTTIHSSSEEIISVVVDINASGHVFATWLEGSTISTVRANHYVPGTGWSIPTMLDIDLTTSSARPRIATASDDVVVAWYKPDTKIYAASYTTSSGWQTESVMEGGDDSLDVAISSTGKTAIAWCPPSPSSEEEYGVRVITRTPVSGWGDTQLLAPNNNWTGSVKLNTDNSGNFLATWYDAEGSWKYTTLIIGNLFQ